MMCIAAHVASTAQESHALVADIDRRMLDVLVGLDTEFSDMVSPRQAKQVSEMIKWKLTLYFSL